MGHGLESIHSEIGKSADLHGLPSWTCARPANARQFAEVSSFDDVIWVQEARRDHLDFVSKTRDRGDEVLDFAVLLGEAMKDKPCEPPCSSAAHVTRNTVGPVIVEALYP